MVDDRPGPWSTNLVGDKPDENHVPIGGIPFNERAALEELEHFRREIERYQALRHERHHEFEHFVQSFKQPEGTRPAGAPAYTPSPAPAAAPKAVAPPMPAPLAEPFIPAAPMAAAQASTASKPAPAEPFQPSRRIESPRPERVEAVPVAEIPVTPTTRAAPSWSSNKWLAIVAGAVVILSVGGYAWLKSSGDSATPPTPSPQQNTDAPTPLPATQAPSAEPAAPPVTKPLPFEAVLTTSAPVWVRLTADGERLFERELEAGQRIPFTARESIVIRAGNPAAVRLTIGGVDQGSLGREGFPVTRRFEVPR